MPAHYRNGNLSERCCSQFSVSHSFLGHAISFCRADFGEFEPFKDNKKVFFILRKMQIGKIDGRTRHLLDARVIRGKCRVVDARIFVVKCISGVHFLDDFALVPER